MVPPPGAFLEPFWGPEKVLEMVPAFVTKNHFPANWSKKPISGTGKDPSTHTNSYLGGIPEACSPDLIFYKEK